MHHSVANDRAKLVSRQRPPPAFIAKLDISSVTIRDGKLRIFLAHQSLADKYRVTFTFQEQIVH